MSQWTCTLELDSQRNVTGGSAEALRDAIRRGADLRIFADAGYDGYLSIENFTLEDPFVIIPRAAEMLRRQMANIAR